MMNIPRYILVFISLIVCVSSAFAGNSAVNKEIYSLDDCISQALKVHPKINMYKQKTGQEEQKLKSAAAEYFPQVDAVASYDRLSYVPKEKQRYLGGSYNDYQTDVVVTQPLFTGGKITSQKQSARYSVDAAKQEYLAAREEVIFGVKTAYYKLMFAQEIVKSKKELLKYAQGSYSIALDLHKKRKTPREEELLRLEVQVNEVMQELLTAQENVRIAQKVLLNAMGLDSAGSIEIKDLKDDHLRPDDMPVEVANNYEILKVSKEVEEAAEQIKIEKSGFYPQLNARYSYGYEWGDWSQRGDPDWVAGIAVNFNIWDWGKTKAEVQQAKAHKEELVSYKNLLSQQIKLDLESARLRHESASKRFKIAEKNLKQAKKSLDLFENRYRDTLVTSLELLDAQKAFSQAQVNFASAKLDLRLAKAEIEKIAGKGYEFK